MMKQFIAVLVFTICLFSCSIALCIFLDLSMKTLVTICSALSSSFAVSRTASLFIYAISFLINVTVSKSSGSRLYFNKKTKPPHHLIRNKDKKVEELYK